MHARPPSAPRVPPAAVLAVSLLGISFAAPLVRLSTAHPLAIAIWRLGFSLVIVAVALAVTGGWRQWRTLRPRDAWIAGAAGIVLALHFYAWNSSLLYTTVAASVVLVNLQPAIVAGLSALVLAERPGRGQVAGIALAMTGALVIGLHDAGGAGHPGSRPLLGDALAVIGAITAAVYYVAGRRLRQRLDLWPYVGLVYGACFVTLLVIALVLRVPVGPQPPRELAIFAALALGPMILGHTGLNWALRYLPAYVVSLTVLGEPVGATVLAAVLPGIGEIPSLVTVAGGALVLAGVVATLMGARRP